MPSIFSAILPALGLACLSIVLLPEARAHGGTYRGPGSGVPSGAGPATPTPGGPGPGTGGGPGGAGPATGGGPVADLTGWELWWGLNREPYLALRTALAQGGAAARTGPADALSGVSGRPTDAQVRLQVVPALLTALRDERNPDIATAALLALAKCGPRLETEMRARASQAIRSRLSDANQEVGETAAVALGVLGNPSDLSLLGDILADGPAAHEACDRKRVPTRTRAFAAYALGIAADRIPNEDTQRWIAHQLVGALLDSPTATRDIPVAALIGLGLVSLDSSAPPPESEVAVAPTRSAGALYAWIGAWFADVRRDPQVRAYAPVTLARIASRSGDELRADCVRRLSEALESGSDEAAVVRQSCVLGLGIVADGDGETHDVRARSLLKLASTEGDRLARRFAWISLARVGARPGIEGRDALNESRAYLLGALSRGSTPERPWLTLALGVGERDATDRGAQPSTVIQEALRKEMNAHTSPSEAGAQLLGLALSRAPAAGVLIMDRVAELVDDDARAYGALALGIAGTTAGIEPLRKLVLESRYKPRLLREAAISLGLLGDRSLTPQLVAMLRDARGLYALSAAATALGYIGDERSVAPLVEIAGDSARDAAARAFAFVALGLVSDPAPVPWNTSLAVDANWWLPPSTLFDPATGTGVLDLL